MGLWLHYFKTYLDLHIFLENDVEASKSFPVLDSGFVPDSTLELNIDLGLFRTWLPVHPRSQLPPYASPHCVFRLEVRALLCVKPVGGSNSPPPTTIEKSVLLIIKSEEISGEADHMALRN